MAGKKKKTDDDGVVSLGTFEDRTVANAAISLRGAGDGLSKNMEIKPVIINTGDDVFIIIKAHCSGVQFEEIKDMPGYLSRVAVLRAGLSTIVDESVVEKALEDQQKVLDDHEGRVKLPFGDAEAEADPLGVDEFTAPDHLVDPKLIDAQSAVDEIAAKRSN